MRSNPSATVVHIDALQRAVLFAFLGLETRPFTKTEARGVSLKSYEERRDQRGTCAREGWLCCETGAAVNRVSAARL